VDFKEEALMKISEAIHQLQALIEQHGDTDIALSYSIRTPGDATSTVTSLDYRESLDKRLEICGTCDRHEIAKVPLTDVTFIRCKECGCAVNIKARFKSFSCPLGKW